LVRQDSRGCGRGWRGREESTGATFQHDGAEDWRGALVAASRNFQCVRNPKIPHPPNPKSQIHNTMLVWAFNIPTSHHILIQESSFLLLCWSRQSFCACSKTQILHHDLQTANARRTRIHGNADHLTHIPFLAQKSVGSCALHAQRFVGIECHQGRRRGNRLHVAGTRVPLFPGRA